MNRVSSRVVFEKTQDAQCIQRCIVQANMQNRYDSRINASISFFLSLLTSIIVPINRLFTRFLFLLFIPANNSSLSSHSTQIIKYLFQLQFGNDEKTRFLWKYIDIPSRNLPIRSDFLTNFVQRERRLIFVLSYPEKKNILVFHVGFRHSGQNFHRPIIPLAPLATSQLP